MCTFFNINSPFPLVYNFRHLLFNRLSSQWCEIYLLSSALRVRVTLQALYLAQPTILQSLVHMVREFLPGSYRSNIHINGQNIIFTFSFLWVVDTWSFPSFGCVFVSLCQAHFQFLRQTMTETVKKLCPIHTVFAGSNGWGMFQGR